jgi:hypothetical protein
MQSLQSPRHDRVAKKKKKQPQIMEQKKVREREGHKSGYSISEKEDERKTLKLSSEMKARPTFNCKS